MGAPGSQPPAGWYPDPGAADHERYWDGAQWTAEVRPVTAAGAAAAGQAAGGAAYHAG